MQRRVVDGAIAWVERVVVRFLGPESGFARERSLADVAVGYGIVFRRLIARQDSGTGFGVLVPLRGKCVLAGV